MLPQTQIVQARQVDLLRLIEPDTTLTRIANTHGGEYAGPCPFCGGTDRFHIVPSAGKWYCRQCTPRGGDSIDYVQRREQIAFQAAVEFLAGSTAHVANRQMRVRPSARSVTILTGLNRHGKAPRRRWCRKPKPAWPLTLKALRRVLTWPAVGWCPRPGRHGGWATISPGTPSGESRSRLLRCPDSVPTARSRRSSTATSGRESPATTASARRPAANTPCSACTAWATGRR